MKYKPSYGIAGRSGALKENGDLLSVASANGVCEKEKEREREGEKEGTRIRRETDREREREEPLAEKFSVKGPGRPVR